MARGILGKLLNMGMSKTLYSQPQKEAPQQKENRKAYREAAEQAIESGNLEVLQKLIPQMRQVGIDPNLYAVQAGQPTAEQSIQKILNEVMRTGQVAQPPGEGTGAAINLPPGGETERGMRRQMADIFTREFAMRAIFKQLTGITLNDDEFYKKQWYNDYASMPGTHKEKMMSLASKYGGIPDDAGSLAEASKEEKRVIWREKFNLLMLDDKYLVRYLNKTGSIDPEIIQKLLNDPQSISEKGRAALISAAMTVNKEWIPQENQDLVNRMIHKLVDTSDFLDADESAYAYGELDIDPKDLSPAEVKAVKHGFARKKRENMIMDTKARAKATYDMKMQEHVSPEMAARHRLPSDMTLGEFARKHVIPISEMERTITVLISDLKRARAKIDRLFHAEGLQRIVQGGEKKIREFFQDNPDLAAWESFRHEMGVLQAKVFAKDAGNISETEQKPHIEGFPNWFWSRSHAMRRINELIARSEVRLRVQQMGYRGADDVLPEPEYQLGDVETLIDDASGVEIPARYEGKDAAERDIWVDPNTNERIITFEED